jgi:RHS repeat-associated protein
VQSGSGIKTFVYTYDPVGNRLTEQIDGTTIAASYNALNQLTTVAGGSGLAATYEWDAEHHLVSVSADSQRTEFTYDGFGRRVGIRLLVNDVEVLKRRFLWCNNDICEERTSDGAVTKQFFPQGMKVVTGTTVGSYFYTKDHLGSVRELLDALGTVRAVFNYDPYGSQTRIAGDLESDFRFTGHFYHAETSLSLTKFRAYDPSLGRWLSRDLLLKAEVLQNPNLYAYVSNDPINMVDSLGEDAWGWVKKTAAEILFIVATTASAGPPPTPIEPVLPTEPGPKPPGTPMDGPPPPPGGPPNLPGGGGGGAGGGGDDDWPPWLPKPRLPCFGPYPFPNLPHLPGPDDTRA